MVLTLSALAVIAAGVLAQVKPQMPPDVGPGHVAWFDISSTDIARAKEFYGQLFHWTFTAVARAPNVGDLTVAISLVLDKARRATCER